MKRLHIVSWIMAALGLIVVATSTMVGLGAAWIIAGSLMCWAGIVKVLVVQIWLRIAHIGTERHIPENSV